MSTGGLSKARRGRMHDVMAGRVEHGEVPGIVTLVSRGDEVQVDRHRARGETMTLRDRIGFDAGSRELEQALAWAARHAFHYLDFNADVGPNHLDRWSADRV